MYGIDIKNQIKLFWKSCRKFDRIVFFDYNICVVLYLSIIKMNEVYQSNPEGLNINKEDYNAVNLSNTIDIIHRRTSETESTEELAEKKFPPIDLFWWVKLSRTATYNVPLPQGTEKLRRTGRACATNPTYENALVMTQDGRSKHETHRETYYTSKSFPVKNIEWRIRSILNSDRARLWLDKIPADQKVRSEGVDWTIRDMNWYIVVAADLSRFPRWTLIMTTLWPGRVYDVWGKVNGSHIDVFTNWEK